MNPADPAYIALHRYTKALSVALGHRDQYTRVHSDRVVALSAEIGMRIGLSETDLGILKVSATFHDIGKIGVPDRILLKPGRLDETETAEMQAHSAMGEDIVLATDLEGATAAARVIRHHHERYDGAGYPDGLAGEDIPLFSRIIGIADSYDAMSTRRAYHPARSHSGIMRVLSEEAGGKHDAPLFKVFVEIIGSSPYKAAEI